jgi:hypothetical protein
MNERVLQSYQHFPFLRSNPITFEACVSHMDTGALSSLEFRLMMKEERGEEDKRGLGLKE